MGGEDGCSSGAARGENTTTHLGKAGWRKRCVPSMMSHAIFRLNAAREGRYAIERELSEGGMATMKQTGGE